MSQSPVSDERLQSIAEQGFFSSAETLTDARSACLELIFARALVRAQTAKIMQLEAAAGARLKPQGKAA